MFECRKIRKLIEMLEVNPNLDTLLDQFTSPVLNCSKIQSGNSRKRHINLVS